MNINKLIKEAHQTAVEHGWHEEERSFGDVIALIHSEASEALEEARAGNKPTQTYYECKYSNKKTCNYYCHGLDLCGIEGKPVCQHAKPCGIPSEFADLLIRVFDTCGEYEIDLEAALKEKMAFNKTRPYKHGKRF